MKYQSLIDTLQLLTKEELKAFEKFIAIGHFNRSERCIKLFKIYKSCKFDFTSSKLKWEKTYRPISSNAKAISTVTSELKDLVEKFLAQQLWEKEHAAHRNYLMLEAMAAKGHKEFVKKHNSINQDHQKLEKKGSDYHYERVLFERQAVKTIHIDNPKVPEYAKREKQVIKTLETLDSFYLIEKFWIATELLNLNYINKTNSSISLLEECLKLANLPPFLNNPTIQLFKTVFQLIQTNDIKYFENLKIQLTKAIKFLTKSELSALYIMCVNHCTEGIFKTGEHKFYAWVTYFNEQRIKHDLVSAHLLYLVLKNIVICYAKLDNFNRPKELLELYKEKLPEDIRKGTYLYCNGLLAFYQNEYQVAIDFFKEAKVCKHSFKTDSYALELKVYYHQDNIEQLLLRSHAFKEYLRVNTTVTSGIAYQNFRVFLERLVKLRSRSLQYKSKDKTFYEDIEKLKTEINLKKISDKNWLLKELKILE